MTRRSEWHFEGAVVEEESVVAEVMVGGGERFLVGDGVHGFVV